MMSAQEIIRAWCASCGYAEPSNGDCIALESAMSGATSANSTELVRAASAVFDMCMFHGDFRNGVTDPTGSIDEGNAIASQYLDALRAAIAKVTGEAQP